MTAVEKAQELVDKMYDEMFYYRDGYNSGDAISAAKKCALIAVDEILDNFGLVCNGQTFYTEHRAFDYYSEVKHELNKSE